jgi:class 3 adenylate cyclase/tetratricopeptide (TPR) repeat protein
VSSADDTHVKTLVLTDIEGSTAHWEHDPDVMAATVARHDDIVRTAVEAAGGRFVRHRGEGDSTFSVFDDADAAVAAAVSLQREMSAERWLTTEPVRVRVGVHTGGVEVREGDYHGRAINRTARVRGRAEGATVLTTAASAALVKDRLPEGAFLVDLGEHPLRGLAGLEHVYAVGHAELPDPEVELQYLRRRAAPPVPTALRLHGETALVGRERELASLNEAWASARGGRATLALVAGEPGVGKTRLAAALAEQAAAGALVLYGRCDEEALRPYQPIAEAFGGALERLSGSEVAAIVGDDAANLALVLPELRSRIPVWGGPTIDRFVLFQAAAKLLARLAAERPVLVLVDDMHWADESSLALLRHALRGQPDARVLVVGTYRETDVGDNGSLLKWLVQLRREVPTIDVSLGGLPRAEVSQLLGSDHADQVDSVWSATDGNPFFVIELRRSLDDNAQRTMPPSVRQSVGDRVERLPTVTRQFVLAAAIAGTDVDVGVAASAAGVDADVASAAVVRGVLTDVPDDPSQLRFVHALVRTAVLEGLTSDTRVELHGQVAAAIHDLHADQIDEHAARLAHHYREAGDLRADGPAYVWSMRAGRRAGQLLAYEEAEHQYRAAGQIAEDDGDVVRRITAELELSEILTRSGRPTTGHEIASAAAAAASAIGATDLAGWAVFNTRFGQAVGLPGNLEAIREARAALAPDSPWRVPVDVVYAGELMQAGEVDTGIELLRAAAARARDADDWAMLGFALTGTHTYVDRLEVPVDEILAAVAKADGTDTPSFRLSPEVLRVQSEGFRLGELVAAGKIRAAREAAADFSARYGDETGIIEANVPLFALADAMLSGHWEEWRRRLDRFREDPERAAGYAPQLTGCEMMAAWLKGRLGEAVALIEALPASLILVRPGLALALSEAGRSDDARRAIKECAADGGLEARARTTFGRAELAVLAYAAAGIGEEEAGAQIYDLLRPRRGQVAAWAAYMIWGAIDGVLGVLAGICGRSDRAVEHLRAALRLHDAAGWRSLSAMTSADLAAALLDRGHQGDVATAVRLITETEPTARELQLTGVQRRLAAIAQQVDTAGTAL